MLRANTESVRQQKERTERATYLGAARPIGRRVGDGPEARHGLDELDGDLSWSRQIFLPIDHVAFLLFSAAHVLDHKPLLGH
jgi:hypothetical protein